MCSSLAAAADDARTTPYCARTRARAAGDAALLMWPRVVAEGVRFPSVNPVEVGPTLTEHFQTRIGLSVSPLDLYRGLRMERVAEADCDAHESAEALRGVVEEATDDAALAAFRAEGAYLESHRSEWQQILSRGVDRLGAGLITAVELQELRRSVGALERKLEVVRGERERLEARARPAASQPLVVLADAFTERSMQLEREASHVRALDAFQVRLTGGVIPSTSQVDWFARVELSYSLGGLASARHEAQYLEARREELKHERYELPARAAELQNGLRAELAKSRRELQVVETQLASVSSTRQVLDASQAPGIEYPRATLLVDQFSLESERVFLRTLADSLSGLAEQGRLASAGSRP
jgi:hypothetical protein